MRRAGSSGAAPTPGAPPATPLIDGAVACGAPANGRSARRAMVMSPANQPPRDARPPEGAGPLVAKSEGQVLRGPRVCGAARLGPPIAARITAGDRASESEQ